MVIFRPASAGPSQTCWPPICKFPDGGTTRSASTATGDGPAGRLAAGVAVASSALPGTARSVARPAPAAAAAALALPGRTGEAGKAMPSDW